MRDHNENGQLLLPILGVLFLFGLFWVTYVLWCQEIYWKMRMDVASDMVALSAARQQATILNYLGTLQSMENLFLPEIKGYGIMDMSMKNDFEGLNQLLQVYKRSFGAQVVFVAQEVAAKNGSNRPILPALDSSLSENTNPCLDPHEVKIMYVAQGWPVGFHTYKEAYYTRHWSENVLKAQPGVHKSFWKVCHDSICSDGRARLWLDVKPTDKANDGGFPSQKASLLRSIGIQCFYPQFNAQLLPKK